MLQVHNNVLVDRTLGPGKADYDVTVGTQPFKYHTDPSATFKKPLQDRIAAAAYKADWTRKMVAAYGPDKRVWRKNGRFNPPGII